MKVFGTLGRCYFVANISGGDYKKKETTLISKHVNDQILMNKGSRFLKKLWYCIGGRV